MGWSWKLSGPVRARFSTKIQDPTRLDTAGEICSTRHFSEGRVDAVRATPAELYTSLDLQYSGRSLRLATVLNALFDDQLWKNPNRPTDADWALISDEQNIHRVSNAGIDWLVRSHNRFDQRSERLTFNPWTSQTLSSSIA